MSKKIIILMLFAFILSSLMAEHKVNSNMTLREISETTKIPVRKMIEYLELANDVDIDESISSFELKAEDVHKAAAKYSSRKKSYYTGIVVVGMGTVFASLIIVALLIAQLRHLDKKKKTPPANLPETAKPRFANADNDDIIAAISTTLYLYELEIEERNKLMLTWKRTPLSMWKASSYILMNEIDPSGRK